MNHFLAVIPRIPFSHKLSTNGAVSQLLQAISPKDRQVACPASFLATVLLQRDIRRADAGSIKSFSRRKP